MSAKAVPRDWHRGKLVSFGDVRRKLEDATLLERNAILAFIRSNHRRIRPSPDDDWLYESMSRYLLDCIAQQSARDVDDPVHTPFEAARELVAWFNWIVSRDDDPTSMQHRIERISNLFRHGSRSVQNCIETGLLEHVLEVPRNRPYFEHWKDDEVLAESYVEALRWGQAHSKPHDP